MISKTCKQIGQLVAKNQFNNQASKIAKYSNLGKQQQKLNLSRNYFSFNNNKLQNFQFSTSSSSQVNIDLQNEAQEEELSFSEKNKELLSGIEDYEKALKFFQKGKYRISNEFFKRVLQNLERTHQQNTLNYVLVLKKLVINQNFLRLYEDSEKTLEKVIEITQNASSSDLLLYREYNNLFIHLLKTNLNKSIILGKALLSPSEVKKIPILYQKLFQFNLGTAYLLKGNFVDAKKRLRDCLMLQPSNVLKGHALNNLAVASWWHKHPNFRDEEEEDDIEQEGHITMNLNNKTNENEEYTFEQIDKDFENVIPLLKRAIYNLEDVDKISDLELKMNIDKLLDQENLIPLEFEKFDPAVKMLITNKDSGICLLNIKEFLFNTSPEKKNEATYWFKYALKFFEQVNPSHIDRCLITLAIFCSSSNQFEKAEGLFKKTLEMLENSDSFNKVLCLQLYGNLLKKFPERYKEGEALIAQAYEISDYLPFWSNKLIHVQIPDLEI